jgi:hypothetical protein
MNKYYITNRGSAAVRHIEAAWGELQSLIPKLPSAIIVIFSASERQRKKGHFAYSSWRYRKDKGAHEIGVSPALFQKPKELLATLLHEAAHALLYQRNPQGGGGCTGPYYHRKDFRDACAELGLKAEFHNTRYGWHITGWPETGIPRRYQRVLDSLKKLPAGPAKPRVIPRKLCPTPAPGHLRLTCQCQPDPRKIYASKAVISKGAILCQECGASFQLASTRES